MRGGGRKRKETAGGGRRRRTGNEKKTRGRTNKIVVGYRKEETLIMLAQYKAATLQPNPLPPSYLRT
jgi:hypothetical protein